MPRSFSDLRRRQSRIEQKVRVTIFCEGQNTEAGYFKALSRRLGDKVIVIPEGGGSDPSKLADLAIQKLSHLKIMNADPTKLLDLGSKDFVWVVFDKDTHEHFNAAMDRCRSKGIPVAYSVPCFEVWLLLHCENFGGVGDSSSAQHRFRMLRPEYDPNNGKKANFLALLGSLEAAETRAEQQLKLRIEERAEYGNPSTTVFELTRFIGRLAKG